MDADAYSVGSTEAVLPMKTVLSIQSQVTGARVGNSVAAFAMERLGVRVFAAPTTLLGRRPDRGAPGGGPVSAAMLRSIFEALEADGRLPEIDAVLSGYLASPEQADVIADVVGRVKAANPKASYVCDPVMGDDGKLYVSDALVAAFKSKLLPIADLIAPNAFELGVLAGEAVNDITSARAAARKLGRAALISSIPYGPNEIAAMLVANGEAFAYATDRLSTNTRGAGDLFAALYLAERIKHDRTAEALERAMGATYDVLLAGGGDLALPFMQDALERPSTIPRVIDIGV